MTEMCFDNSQKCERTKCFSAIVISLAVLVLAACAPTLAATINTTIMPAGASSARPGHQAGDAIGSGRDGGTGWIAGPGSAFPQWLTIDLGGIYDIAAVRQTFAAADIWNYKIEGSNDDQTDDPFWTVLADHTAGVQGQAFADRVSGSFRYLRVYVTGAQTHVASSLKLQVAGTLTPQSSSAVPRPVPVATPGVTVGAQACNLWTNKVDWLTLVNYPARISNMGYYNEAYDVATDWQIKAAVEHGIGFMQSCWYRQAGNEGAAPVMASYDQFIHSLANTAKYRAMLKWDIDWINNQAGVGGVSGEADFVNNLVPFWINSYFSKPNYLKIDGKPVLSIYDFEAFINQMGGLSQAQAAITAFRSAVQKAGYAGLILMAQQSGPTTPANHWVAPNDPRGIDTKFGNYYTHDYSHTDADAAAAGFNRLFAYHLPTFTDLMVSSSPTDAQAISEQQQAWANLQSYSALPTVVTASVGWDASPWGENNASWRLTAADWGTLLADAKQAVVVRQSEGTADLLLLDNWNEYGEGHYISPTKQDGYAYIDQVLANFAGSNGNMTKSIAEQSPNIASIPQVLNAEGQPTRYGR